MAVFSKMGWLPTQADMFGILQLAGDLSKLTRYRQLNENGPA
jgi:hypothetical protein